MSDASTTAAGGAAPVPETVTAFVNERPVAVPRGASALDAVRALDPALAAAVAAGERTITDSRGLPVAPASAAHGGAIYRLIPARRPAAAPDTE